MPLFLLLKVDLFHHHMGLLKDFLEEMVQAWIRVAVVVVPEVLVLLDLRQTLLDLEELEEQHLVAIL